MTWFRRKLVSSWKTDHKYMFLSLKYKTIKLKINNKILKNNFSYFLFNVKGFERSTLVSSSLPINLMID